MSKQKHKGVRYIAKSLAKYYGSQYGNYREALPKAREVYGELSRRGEKVILKNIRPLVGRKVRGRKGKVSPELDPELAVPIHYFDLQRYPILISRVSSELWFTSKLIPSETGDIQGGSMPDYGMYFAPYVGYINALASEYEREEGRYNEQWFVMCTPPVFNRYRKRWESKIISVDGNGTPIDYGFDPKKPSKQPSEPSELPTPTPKPESAPESKETAKTGVSEQDVKLIEAQTKQIQAQTEQKRQENISQLLKMFGEGQLSKAEFKELMSKIK